MQRSQHSPHTVVVGAGLAGLTTATYLARTGHAVTVVEKAVSAGGRAATDLFNGFALNRGAHALYTGDAASDVLRELGVAYRSGTPKHVFTADARRAYLFPASPLDLLRSDLFDAADKRELLGFFLRLGLQRVSDFADVPIARWVERSARRPRVQQLLTAVARTFAYSAALDLASADTVVARLQQTFRHPVHYVDGGWRTLVDGLRGAAEEAGVTIQTGLAAEAVLVHAGRAAGVRLHDQPDLRATNVVLAVPPAEALRLVERAPAPHLARVVEQLVPATVACLDVALARLPSSAVPVLLDLEQPRFMTAQSVVARLAPGQGAVIHLFKQLDPRVASDPHRDRVDLEAVLDRFQAGWRSLVVESRFLPHLPGSSLLPQARYGGQMGRPAPRSVDVSNVYFAGDWVGPRGYLADAVFGSAREAARQIDRSTRLAVAA